MIGLGLAVGIIFSAEVCHCSMLFKYRIAELIEFVFGDVAECLYDTLLLGHIAHAAFFSYILCKIISDELS